MRTPRQFRSATTGFTLVEMLVVVAILVLLMALVLAGINKARRQAEVQRARLEVQTLAAAFQAYFADQATWPWIETAENPVAVSTRVVQLLRGTHLTGGTPNLQGNPRQRVYLDFKPTQLNAAGAYVDPWGNPYQAVLDANGDQIVPGPWGPSGWSNRVPVIVWSLGPDGMSDVTGEMSNRNKDNVRSY